MKKFGETEVQYPKITESLLTLLLLHGQIGFIIAVFKICTLNLPIPETGQITTADALILVWMSFRSVADMFMGLRFLISLISKDMYQKYENWISYSIFATCFDVALAIILFHQHQYVGIEVTSLIMDSLIKITIALIMNDLRKKEWTSGNEKAPLLG